jgi:hypothetical protein
MVRGLIFLLFVVLLITISTAIFIGAGYILSLMFSLTLFQASILCIGASFVSAFIIFTTMLDDRTFKVVHVNNKKHEVFEVDEVEEEETEDNFNGVVTVVRPKVGRNDPCPCGSRKKYRFCCGKKKL